MRSTCTCCAFAAASHRSVWRFVRCVRAATSCNRESYSARTATNFRGVRLGIDSGGTFTDVVADDGRIAKVASTPDDPARGVARAIDAVGDGVDVLAHGTTVATNALLERRGATVALIATDGFADEIEIARQVRPSLYDPFSDRPAPLVPRSLRFGVAGRLDAHGEELAPFDGR